MDCVGSTSTNKGTSIRKFIKWKIFLLALRPLELSSYSKLIHSKGTKISKLDIIISTFILPMVMKFVLVPTVSHYRGIFLSVYDLIIDAKSCQLLVFFLCNVIIIAISFKNSKPSEEDHDFGLDEPLPVLVQNEKNVEKQEEKNDHGSEEMEENLLISDAYEIGDSYEFNSFEPAVDNCEEQIATLVDDVHEGYVSDYENDSQNGDYGGDSSNFGDSDNDDDYSEEDSSNFGDDNNNDEDDLNLRAEEFIAKTNERWRAERLREYNLYTVSKTQLPRK